MFEVRNITDRVWVASAGNLSNSLSSTTGLQNDASVLANSGGIYAGYPRSFFPRGTRQLLDWRHDHETAGMIRPLARVAAGVGLAGLCADRRGLCRRPVATAGGHGDHQMGDPRGGCTVRICGARRRRRRPSLPTVRSGWPGPQADRYRSPSVDRGRTYSTPVRITPAATTLDSGADERPQILVDGKGRVTVAYAIFGTKIQRSDLTSVSHDDGRHFHVLRRVRSRTTVRVSASSPLQQDADGQVFAAWIDKRHVVSEKRPVGTLPARH